MAKKSVRYIKEGASALVVSVIVSLILVLLSAMILKLFSLDVSYVTVINTVIKIISVMIAVLLCFKTPSDGWIRGVITGLLFALLSHVVYGAISSDMSITVGFFADLGLGIISGLVAGIIAVNVKKRSVGEF